MDRGATTKIDPSQIPRPPLFTRPQDGQPTPIYYPRRAVESQITPDSIQAPPPADSRFLVVDDGNASPQLIRSTLYGIPMDKATVRKCGDVDMAILCHPLALASQDYTLRKRVLPDESLFSWQDPQAIPVERSTLPDKPPRCSRCLAYINPFWDIQGQACNLCGTKNKTASLGVAIQSLPFQVGTVEYVVGGPYVTRPTPVQPVILYALDLTCPSIASYTSILEQVLYDSSSHFHRQAAHSKAAPRAGIVLVSSTGIHLPHPQGGFLCMPDVTEDPFCPLPLTEWTWNLATPRGLEDMQMFLREYRESALDALVQQTNTTRTRTTTTGTGTGTGASGYSLSCGGAAMAFLVDTLQHCGGRAVWISWRRPNHGVGSLRDRERLKEAYTRYEGFLYSPLQNQPEARVKEHSGDEAAANFYKALGDACAKNRIAMDIFLHTDPSVPQSFLDLATLGEVCRVSNGRLVWVKNADWQDTFREELLRSALGFSGWDAVFKVRCSTGLQVKSFVSNVGVVRDGGLVGSPELELSVVTPDTCIAVDLEHRVGGLPKESKYVYLQTALLYTTLFGERRCRVSTLALRTASMAADCFRSMDFGAVATLQMRQAASPLLSPIHDEAGDNARIMSRHDLLARCVKILASYRLHTTAVNSPLGQLILPDKLQLLPLFAMAIIKGPLLSPSMPKRGSGARSAVPSPRGDERAFYLLHASSASPACAMLMAHPNLFPIENLQDGAGEWQAPIATSQADGSPIPEHNKYVLFPPSIHPTIASLDDKGIYLLDTCFAIYLFVGRDAPGDKIEEVKQYLADPAGCDLAISRLVWQMRTFCHVGGGSESTVRPSFPPVILVKQSEGQDSRLSQDFMRWMVCDSNTHERDFVDFLCDIHRQIRSKVDAGRA
jgi:protein transport protein SEC24